MEGVEDKGGDVAGYMPLQRQVGFIYDNPNPFIIAHELGHGAFNLRHTFSPESFIAAERTTQNLMDYNGGTELWKHQWEFIRDPQNIWFAWAQDEGEGEGIFGGKLVLLDAKHTLLLNHVYDNNHESSLKYKDKIEKSRQESPTEMSLDLDYTDTEEKEWINTWKLRTATSDEILAKIINKIQSAEKGTTIEKMSLNEKAVYIGQYRLDNIEYPIAIYSEKAEISKLVKVQVSAVGDLEKEENKKHLKSEETFIKYMIIAFYEEGNTDPVLIIQVEKYDISKIQNTKEKWLKHLGILTSGSLSSTNNVNLKIYEGNEERAENSIFTITANPPTMPDVRASAESSDTIRFRLKIEYIVRKTWTDNRGTHTNELVREDISWFPNNGWQDVKSGEIWDIDFGNMFRGGKAYLFCKINSNVLDTIVFHIRGENPSEADVHNYVNTLANADGWYVPKIIRQESSFRQFNTGVSSATNTFAGMPIWAASYGWGMKQLDNLGSEYGYRTVLNGTVVREGGALPDELWNWQTNVRKGIEFFNGAKLNVANTRWNNALNQIATWEAINPELAQDSYSMIIIDSPDESEENTTVTEIVAGNSTNSETFVANANPDNGQRTLRDAFACKYYNGGADYFSIVIPVTTGNTGEDPPELTHWEIDKEGSTGRDYVDDISGRAGW